MGKGFSVDQLKERKLLKRDAEAGDGSANYLYCRASSFFEQRVTTQRLLRRSLAFDFKSPAKGSS